MPQTAPMMSLPMYAVMLQLILLTESLVYFSSHAHTTTKIINNKTQNNTYWLW
nr:TPA_asm: ATP8 [Gammarus wautieri]